MKPTKELMNEHGAIELMLDILDKVSDKLDSGEVVDINDLESIINFIKIFADKCHHHKEEDLLFPAMEKAGIPKESGPIGVMLNDHREGRRYVRKMTEAMVGVKGSRIKSGMTNKKEARIFSKNAKNYTNLLREHINKEDNILYPIADDCLTSQEQKELKNGFVKVEEEIVGHGKHEEFHRLLDALKKKYLV